MRTPTLSTNYFNTVTGSKILSHHLPNRPLPRSFVLNVIPECTNGLTVHTPKTGPSTVIDVNFPSIHLLGFTIAVPVKINLISATIVILIKLSAQHVQKGSVWISDSVNSARKDFTVTFIVRRQIGMVATNNRARSCMVISTRFNQVGKWIITWDRCLIETFRKSLKRFFI